MSDRLWSDGGVKMKTASPSVSSIISQVERAISADSVLPATILRLPMVYGPGDLLNRLYPVVKRIHDGRPAIVYEESVARCVPCRGYVEDVAHAIALATVSDSAASRVYNVAEPELFTKVSGQPKLVRSLDGMAA